jgi:hypothetical protein
VLALMALMPFGLRLASEALAYMFLTDRLVMTVLLLPLLVLGSGLLVLGVGAWASLGLLLRSLLRTRSRR